MRTLYISLLLPLSYSLFTKDFANFIEDNYGETFLHLLQRKDLGNKGSFGGKINADEVLHLDPVIFVHGVSDTAGEKMNMLAEKFVANGYTGAELYSTTYSSGSQDNPISWLEYSMKCEYVKQIRALILAVRYYTGKDVDVVAYSLGVPIARKAILGGFCIDSDEELGSPLTKYVDTFVGIAGPNHGIALKIVGVPVPACVLGSPAICNRITGLYSGLCPLESMYLNNINKKEHYEGKFVYSIYSQADQLLGYKVCDKITASIPGEDGHKSFMHLSHDDVLSGSLDTVLNVVQNHSTFGPFHLPKVDRNVPRNVNQSTTAATTSLTTSKIAASPTSSASIEPEIVKTLESIFTNTKQSDLVNIRNFFRQKFVEEEVEDITRRSDFSSTSKERPTAVSRPYDNSNEHNPPKNYRKNAPEADRIRSGAEEWKEQKNEKSLIEDPTMETTQRRAADGYHTLIKLSLHGN